MAKRHRITAARLHTVTVSDKTEWRHVVMETDSGYVGLGEASLSEATPAFAGKLRGAVGQMVGRHLDSDALAALGPLLALGLEGRTVHAACDHAIRDLQAQIAGVPLYAELGGGASDIALYANINRATLDRTPAGCAASAAAAVADGHCAIKIAAFDDLTPDQCGTPAGDALIAAGLNRLRAIAEVPGVEELMVDCHWRFDPVTARTLVDPLREIGVCWLECPIAETPGTIAEIVEVRRLANRAGMRLTGLETHGDWQHVRPFVEQGAYDVIMPDVKHVGRLDDILEIHRRATACGVEVSLHNPTGPVAHMISVHVAAAAGLAGRMEFQWNESPKFFALTDPAPRMTGGTCAPTKGAGIGVQLTPEGCP